jgi:hypothetical protein
MIFILFLLRHPALWLKDVTTQQDDLRMNKMIRTGLSRKAAKIAKEIVRKLKINGTLGFDKTYPQS